MDKVLIHVPRGFFSANVLDPETMEIVGSASQIYSDGGWAVHTREWAGYTPASWCIVLDDNKQSD